jgi:GGDEF domain-containing protein
MSKAGGGKRKLAQMERVRELVAPAHILDRISEDEFRTLMHEETIIVEFEADRAKRALPKLLRTAADRRHARELLDVMQSHFRLDVRQRALANELKALLPVPTAARVARGRTSPTKRTAVKNKGKKALVARNGARLRRRNGEARA